MDMDSDGSGEDASYEGHLEDNAGGKNNSSSTSYLSAYKATASARHVSSTLATTAKLALSSPQSKVSFVNDDHEECCADSGATEHMLPDYKAFVSYKSCQDEYVTLGDTTKLPIMGRGTARFYLNDKVVEVRNALHVPGLRAPLYSLRRHRHMFDCGYYSQFGVGSFILFPTFTIKVDDSEDNLVSFKAIGRSPCKRVDYKEPKHPQARPAAHLIPDDDTQHVSFHIPDPKARKLPTPPPAKAVDPEQPPITDPDTVVVSDEELTNSATKPLTKRMLSAIHEDPALIQPVPPQYTPAPAENTTKFDSLRLHRIFGCRRFKNQLHITSASQNAELIRCGEMPTTIGDYTTINKPAKGKPLTKRHKYLEKVHLDIVFGDCVALGGYRYAIILVDVATRFTWVFGLTSLSSTDIIEALLAFRAAAGGLPKCFHSDFDKKLMGGRALHWILDNKSNIKAAPARRQSSNGLVERTWQTLVHMARSYITEKQVGREFWYWAVRHAAMMLNQVPGRLGRKLTTPFELIYNKKPDSKTWFELFSVGYFPVESKAGEAASASQSHSLDGIAIGRDDKSNTILFYNPLTKKYYSPSVFKLEQSHLPVMLYPKHIRYDGGFVCGPLRNRTDPISEPFPPGTRVYIPKGDSKVKGTIQNVPLPFSNIGASTFVASSDPDSDTKTTYTVLLDDGTTARTCLSNL
jgi:transposase InsO family protein